MNNYYIKGLINGQYSVSDQNGEFWLIYWNFNALDS